MESQPPTPTDDHGEPEPNTQLSEYGKLMRARFEIAARHSAAVLLPAFHGRFHREMTEWLERDWNYFGNVDSFVVNGKIPFVADVLRAANKAGLLSEDEKQAIKQDAQ